MHVIWVANFAHITPCTVFIKFITFHEFQHDLITATVRYVPYCLYFVCFAKPENLSRLDDKIHSAVDYIIIIKNATFTG